MKGSAKLPGWMRLLGLAGLFICSRVFSGGVVSNPSQSSLTAAMSGGGTVTFGINGTIYLTNTITVSNNTVLDATGQTVTISGSKAVQIFIVNSGASLVLSNLTLADGFAAGAFTGIYDPFLPGCGGAISNAGTLQAVNCVFTNNGALGYHNNTDYFVVYSTGGFGGAVYNAGSVSLSRCVFITNWAIGGIGTSNITFPLTLSGGNGNGGALFNANLASVVDCLFSNNVCLGGHGAAVYQNATIENTVGGDAGSAGGGAIYTLGGLVASNCTFAFNLAVGGTGGTGSTGYGYQNYSGGPGWFGGTAGQAGGGGLCVQSGTANIVNSTFWSNGSWGGIGGAGGPGGTAYSRGTQGGPGGIGSQGGTGTGGAICNLGGSLILSSITVASNVAVGGAAGAAGVAGIAQYPAGPNCSPGTNGAPGVPQGDSLANPSGTLSLINSILAANSSTDTNIFGPVTDAGHNLSFDNQNSLTNSTSLNGVNPKLGPLANNGGPTPTMALLSGSPAMDAGDPSSFPATDQRGYPRPFGPAPDIGAFEYSPAVLSGNIVGLWSPDQAAVFAGTTSTLTTNGAFTLPLSAGPYTLSPSNANYVFSPASQNITVGDSGTNVNFQAYRINALTLGTHTNGGLQFTFAGSNGQSFRILASSNLSQWNPVATNALGAVGFLGVALPATNSSRQFYRVVSP